MHQLLVGFAFVYLGKALNSHGGDIIAESFEQTMTLYGRLVVIFGNAAIRLVNFLNERISQRTLGTSSILVNFCP